MAVLIGTRAVIWECVVEKFPRRRDDDDNGDAVEARMFIRAISRRFIAETINRGAPAGRASVVHALTRIPPRARGM